MFRLESCSVKMWMAICLLFALSCQKPDVEKVYIVSEGEHYAAFREFQLSGNRIDFKVLIHESWYYENLNQWNKLIGFSQGINHHQNSARVGWMCLDGQILFCLYLYVDGEAIREPLQGDYPPGWVSGSLWYNDGMCGLKISENEITHRSKKKNATHLLHPYFGGHTSAPHDVYFIFKHLRY